MGKALVQWEPGVLGCQEGSPFRIISAVMLINHHRFLGNAFPRLFLTLGHGTEILFYTM